MWTRFRKGDDPADWVTVDPVTGKITTSKSLDRESHFVNGSLYTVLIYAVDNGMIFPCLLSVTFLFNRITESSAFGHQVNLQ